MNSPARRAVGNTAGLPDDAWPRVHDFCKVVARVLHRCAFRVRAYGLGRLPRTGPVVLIANHSSLVEPQLMYGWLPRRTVFLIKEELDVGVTGWAMKRIGQIPVHRGGANRTALANARQVLSSGGMICVFPEGMRGSGDVTRAEGGAAWLARASGALVVPLVTRGTLRPEGSARRFRPRVDMLVGEPLAVDIGKGRKGLDEGTEKLRHELAELVHTLDDRRAQGRKNMDETGDDTK